VDNPTNVPVRRNVRFSAAQETEIERGIDDFRRMVDGDVLLDYNSIGVLKTKRGRSYHLSGDIYLSSSARTKQTVHELGHALEYYNNDVHEQALAFYDSRTAGEKTEWLGDNYDKDEITRRDKFLSPYMGKDYGRRATEIVSMGMEYYWKDPLTFARDDPEYFDFIFDLLRGR